MTKRWGVFKLYYENGFFAEVHIAPCTEDGYVQPPHRLAPDCLCEPRIEQDEDAVPVYVHSRSQ